METKLTSEDYKLINKALFHYRQLAEKNKDSIYSFSPGSPSFYEEINNIDKLSSITTKLEILLRLSGE